jgi:hypothetical protein
MSTRPRHGNQQSRPNQPKSLMRNLGEFFGHIAHGVKSQPQGDIPTPPASSPAHSPAATDQTETKGPTRVVREHVQEQEIQTPQGKMVLRRRIIDEVEPPRE